MKTIHKFKKLTIILMVFIGVGIGMHLGVGFSKSIGSAFELVKWQKEILIGSIALLLFVPIFRKAMHLITVNFEKDIVLTNIVTMFLQCALLGFAFNLLFSSVVFLLLYFLNMNV